MTRSKALLALLMALMMLAAACGSDSTSDSETEATNEGADTTESVEETTTTEGETETETTATEDSDVESTAGFPVEIDSGAGTFTLESAPQAIVSLSPAATEILFAIGAGPQVVAVDSLSNYPADAPVTDLSAFDPNVEAITAYDPDLVVIAYDANDLVASLTELGIPVLLDAAPIDIESGYANMAIMGQATGQVDQTAEVVANMRDEVAAAFASAPADVSARVYHELDDTYFSATSATFIGTVYAEMGLTNIADDADPDGSGYPQLTEEYIVEADPQLMVMMEQSPYTIDDVLARPGWESVAAIANNNVIAVDADIASRWGPRLPQFITAVAGSLNEVVATS